MLNQFSRTQLLLGEEGMKKLAGARVAVFGISHFGLYYLYSSIKMISTAMKAKTAMDCGCFGNIYISFLS